MGATPTKELQKERQDPNSGLNLPISLYPYGGLIDVENSKNAV